MKWVTGLLFVFSLLLFTACKNSGNSSSTNKDRKDSTVSVHEQAVDNDSTEGAVVETAIGELELPPPYETESVANPSKIINWKENETPQAPEGFKVERFAEGLTNPRLTYVAPNGDYFVAQSSENNILLFRDKDEDGIPEMKKIFLNGLNAPFGMLILGGYFYVGNKDGIYRYPYKKGVTKIEEEGEKILDLPGKGMHWTRNIVASPDEEKLYINVGSSSNYGENGLDKEKNRADVIEINPDGSGKRIYADGLRNPVGAAFNPVTDQLWVVVNERDGLGDHLVPDYATPVEEDGFYGWPFSYYGGHKDPRWEDAPHEYKVAEAIVPDVPLGNHVAPLGFTFYTAEQFPERYKNGAFVGEHGSWNSAKPVGYKVVFIPFQDGKPQPPEDFLTGFTASSVPNRVHGRPVGVAQTPDGALLVNDDGAGIIWRVSKK